MATKREQITKSDVVRPKPKPQLDLRTPSGKALPY